MAAEEMVKALKAASSDLESYEQRAAESLIAKDLYETRDMKQPFAKGFVVGAAPTERDGPDRGTVSRRALDQLPDKDAPMSIGTKKDSYPRADGKYTFDICPQCSSRAT